MIIASHNSQSPNKAETYWVVSVYLVLHLKKVESMQNNFIRILFASTAGE
jgi:hypothetical protein